MQFSHWSYPLTAVYKLGWDMVGDLTHSSSSAPSPSPGFWVLAASALLAMILSVHDAPAFSSPAKLHLVTVPLSTLAKETGSKKVEEKVRLLRQHLKTQEKKHQTQHGWAWAASQSLHRSCSPTTFDFISGMWKKQWKKPQILFMKSLTL